MYREYQNNKQIAVKRNDDPYQGGEQKRVKCSRHNHPFIALFVPFQLASIYLVNECQRTVVGFWWCFNKNERFKCFMKCKIRNQSKCKWDKCYIIGIL